MVEGRQRRLPASPHPSSPRSIPKRMMPSMPTRRRRRSGMSTNVRCSPPWPLHTRDRRFCSVLAADYEEEQPLPGAAPVAQADDMEDRQQYYEDSAPSDAAADDPASLALFSRLGGEMPVAESAPGNEPPPPAVEAQPPKRPASAPTMQTKEDYECTRRRHSNSSGAPTPASPPASHVPECSRDRL